MKRFLSYVLLCAMSLVLMPKDLWHHCEAEEHHCESEGTHIDDKRFHLSCALCEFKLIDSEPAAVHQRIQSFQQFLAQVTIPVNSDLFSFKEINEDRGPPAMA